MHFSRVLIPLLFGACGGATQGAHPHDMSASGHEAAAAREEQQAEAHGAQYDPAHIPDACGKAVCWTSLRNPTKHHLYEAAAHRKAAADHRTAARELTDAETRACTGVDPDDRDMSPFAHREDVATVTPLGEAAQSQGARIVFKAVRGLDASALQQLVDCHLARAASLGHDVPEMSYCPLMLWPIAAKVSAGNDGLGVSVTSTDPAVAQAVLKRAQALAVQ